MNNDFILLEEIISLKSSKNNTPERIDSLISRIQSFPLWRYKKDGEFDQFTYVRWKDEDAKEYDETMFYPIEERILGK